MRQKNSEKNTQKNNALFSAYFYAKNPLVPFVALFFSTFI